jgi:hypothetical protein
MSVRQRSGLRGIAEPMPQVIEKRALAGCGYTSGRACHNGGRFGNRRVSANRFMRYSAAEWLASDMQAGWQSGSWRRCRIEGKAGLAFR